MAATGVRRRSVLQLAAAGLSGAARPCTAWAEPAETLKAAAAAAGLRFGTDSDVPIATAPAEYQALLTRQCDLLAPILSWAYVAGRQPGDPEPIREDPNIGFARAHGMTLTGGHLLWYDHCPAWFAGLDAAAARDAVARHIAQMAGHYAGQVYSWNVVNETIDTRRGDADGLRTSVLTETLGQDHIAAAFRSARAADPHALLLYNDAQFEMATRYHAGRRDALFRLLDRLQRAGAPIDGVGLQSHVVLDDTTFDPGTYAKFVHDIASRGLKIVLTELDVFDKRGGPDIAARDADVAARYTALLDVALSEQAVKAVVVWGLSDRYTWLDGGQYPQFRRPDRVPNRPLAFDAEFRPKPAFRAIMDALRRAPKRSAG